VRFLDKQRLISKDVGGYPESEHWLPDLDFRYARFWITSCLPNPSGIASARAGKRNGFSGMNIVVVSQRHHYSGALEWRHSNDQKRTVQKWKIRSLATVS
jgi:hypothetical protein